MIVKRGEGPHGLTPTAEASFGFEFQLFSDWKVLQLNKNIINITTGCNINESPLGNMHAGKLICILSGPGPGL